MYGDLVLIERSGKLETGERILVGDAGKDEAWLRNTLFSNPQIIPIDDIDSSFGPLVPLCTELRTDVGSTAGSIDAVFVNELGRLTLVEASSGRIRRRANR